MKDPFAEVTIRAFWKEFAKFVFAGKAIHEVQHREMEKAFYGGFHAALIVCRDIVGDEDMPEDTGVDILQRLHDEHIP